MLDLVNGLPVHPLVVHAVVVLLPLACVGTVAIALVPRWRGRYGMLVLATAVVATLLLPVATSSGEALEERVGDPGAHAALGETLIWFALPVVVLGAALVWIDRRGRVRDRRGATRPTTAVRLVAGAAVIAALATSVQVYRVGDSGARAVWHDQVTHAGSTS